MAYVNSRECSVQVLSPGVHGEWGAAACACGLATGRSARSRASVLSTPAAAVASGVSNGPMHSPHWPKVDAGKEALRTYLSSLPGISGGPPPFPRGGLPGDRCDRGTWRVHHRASRAIWLLLTCRPPAGVNPKDAVQRILSTRDECPDRDRLPQSPLGPEAESSLCPIFVEEMLLKACHTSGHWRSRSACRSFEPPASVCAAQHSCCPVYVQVCVRPSEPAPSLNEACLI